MTGQHLTQELTARELHMLLMAGQAMSHEQREERICQWACDAVTSLLAAPHVAVVLAPGDGNGLKVVYGKTKDLPLSESVSREIAQLEESDWPTSGEPGRVATLDETRIPLTLARDGISHLARVEIRTIRQRFGVLLAGMEAPWKLSDRQSFVLTTLANQAAIALENSRSHRRAVEQARTVEALVQATPLAIVALDSDARVQMWNPAAERIFGWSEQEVLGGPLPLTVPEDQGDALFSTLEGGPRGEAIAGLEARGIRKDGPPVDVSVATAPLYNAGGRIIGTIVVIEDISERKHREETLRAQEHFIQKVANSTPNLIYVFDVNDQRNIYFNERVSSILGYTPEQMQAMGSEMIGAVVHPDDFGLLGKHLEETIQAGDEDVIEVEYRMKHADGEWHWFRSRSVVFARDQDGSTRQILGTTEDVTDRRQAEELRSRLAAIVEFSDDAIIGGTLEGVITSWNSGAERMYGYSADEIIGRSILVLAPPDRLDDVPRILEQIREGVHIEPFETQRVRKNGEVIDVSLAVSPVRDAQGKIIGVSAIARDMTSHKLLYRQVQEEQQRLKTVLDTSPVGIIVVDAEKKTLLANREFERILGFSTQSGDSIERYRDAAMIRKSDGSVYAREELPFNRVISTGETIIAEEVLAEFHDGRTVPFLFNATPLYSSEGKVIGAIGATQDLTALEVEHKQRNEFLATVSHELRTPLSAIKGAAATMRGSGRPFDASEARELFQIIEDGADRLMALVNNLLDLSRVETGMLSVTPEPGDFRTIAQEAREVFAHSCPTHKLQLLLPDEIPRVNVDRYRILQVLTNLLSNAAKFSPPAAPVTVEVEQDAMYLTVHVQDRGRGFSGEQKARLFTRFAQIHQDASHEALGSGLGLAICKGIVESHGGRIWADSAGEGQGATFSFTLPFASESYSPASPAVDESQGAISAERRGTVLAVDDNPYDLRLLRRIIQEGGYHPIATDNPSEVARLIEREGPDLVLLDLMFPGSNGLDLLQQIRECSDVPVIVVTGRTREEDTVRALRIGADDYVTKPFSPPELLARLEAVARRRSPLGQPQPPPPILIDDLTINLAERQVTCGGRPVSLSNTEYRLLQLLAINAGRVLTYDRILESVWGPDYSGETELVRSMVRHLRRRLGDNGNNPRYILNEPGVGYRLANPKPLIDLPNDQGRHPA